MATDDGRFTVLEADVEADWVRVGRPTVIHVTVENPGPARDLSVEVTHDGAPVTTKSISLSGNGTATYDLEVTFRAPQEGPVAVSGVPAGDLTVAPRDEPTPTPDDGTNADGGAPAAPVLVAALLGLGWLRRRLGSSR